MTPRRAGLAIVGGESDAEVMTREQVASWLKVRPRQVERLGVPCLKLGRKTVRYYKADVVTWLQQQRAGGPK